MPGSARRPLRADHRPRPSPAPPRQPGRRGPRHAPPRPARDRFRPRTRRGCSFGESDGDALDVGDAGGDALEGGRIMACPSSLGLLGIGTLGEADQRHGEQNVVVVADHPRGPRRRASPPTRRRRLPGRLRPGCRRRTARCLAGAHGDRAVPSRPGRLVGGPAEHRDDPAPPPGTAFPGRQGRSAMPSRETSSASSHRPIRTRMSAWIAARSWP